MTYSYEYPHPAVTTDIIVFTVQDDTLKVLLIKRGADPFINKWALPGGFIKMDEDTCDCAKRELEEETGVKDVYLEQLYTFSSVDRDPRERVISVAYFTLIPSEKVTLKPDTDAADAKWFNINELPALAFDHDEILEMAVNRLSAKMTYSTIGLQFMPEKFTLSRLQKVYEATAGKPLDKRNFRKWILSLDLLEETGEKFADGPQRPAMLYRAKDPASYAVF
ncbi:NUDIX domain-containing protein [Kordiimonas sp. SCSIO 12610]|uniref:NUDIX hydrolase n=1 Tax=Kordiimonas sp. SCSIO 12610 TaxID=2829597 RepID=UPI0021096817|nr:NUDIX domain-containing protein [Kordiimonas sp. SCSIO 12610]UTW56332.1 NUDIX hydrolase [Kordiimonas sp. SCSIO 12610]